MPVAVALVVQLQELQHMAEAMELLTLMVQTVLPIPVVVVVVPGIQVVLPVQGELADQESLL